MTAAIAHRQLTAESAGAIDSVRIFSAFTISATFWLLLTTAVGLLLSFKFTYPDLGTYQMLSFGRLRAIHTNGTFYGWASVALTGLAFYVAARSSGVQLRQRGLAWAALWCYNIAAAAGTITLDLGISKVSQEYREWVWPVAFIFLLAVVLSGIVVVATVMARTGHDIYISNWYTIGAFIFTTILGITAAIPVYQYGLGQVAVQGFYMHNAVGMWFTFLALGLTYYALPKLLNRPIYLLRAGRARLLDKPRLLSDYRRASLRVLTAALVVSDARHRVQRRHARAGLGRFGQLLPHDARPLGDGPAFVRAAVLLRRHPVLFRRLDVQGTVLKRSAGPASDPGISRISRSATRT